MMSFNDIAEKLENNGYKVYGIFLYGSQNYGTATPESDHDFKAVIVPHFMDMIKRKETSFTMSVRDDDGIETGLCDVKDIRDFIANIKKQNINYVETLFTDYTYINPEFKDEHAELLKHAEEIARLDEKRALASMKGNMLQSYIRMTKDTDTTHADIEKYGYHRKSLSNVVRLADSIKKYAEHAPYKDVILCPEALEYKLNVKENFMEIAEEKYSEASEICDRYIAEPKNLEMVSMLDDFTADIIRKVISREI